MQYWEQPQNKNLNFNVILIGQVNWYKLVPLEFEGNFEVAPDRLAKLPYKQNLVSNADRYDCKYLGEIGSGSWMFDVY